PDLLYKLISNRASKPPFVQYRYHLVSPSLRQFINHISSRSDIVRSTPRYFVAIPHYRRIRCGFLKESSHSESQVMNRNDLALIIMVPATGRVCCTAVCSDYNPLGRYTENNGGPKTGFRSCQQKENNR